MYETLEYWKQYKQKQEKLKLAKIEIDKFLTKLIAKNGITKY